MKCRKATITMKMKKRKDINTLTDVRTLIAMDWYGIKKVVGRPDNINRIFASDLPWQERIAWMNRINDYTGSKNENLEWWTIIHNSEEKARELLAEKGKRVAGENNPGYQHGGKFSPFSKGSVNYNPDLSKQIHEKMREEGNYTTKIEYYLNKGMSQEDAEFALHERQAVGRKEKFIERYGEEDGLRRWNERQAKWMSTLDSKSDEEKARINSLKNSAGYTISKAEKEIFSHLKNLDDNVERAHPISYDEDGKRRSFVYDIIKDNRIIEYNGDYWHCNPAIYNEDFIHPVTKKSALEIWEKEEKKIKLARDNGFEILVVWESDYKSDKEGALKKCQDFLLQ